MTSREKWIILLAIVACLLVGSLTAIVTQSQCSDCWYFEDGLYKHNTCTGDSYIYAAGEWKLR